MLVGLKGHSRECIILALRPEVRAIASRQRRWFGESQQRCFPKRWNMIAYDSYKQPPKNNRQLSTTNCPVGLLPVSLGVTSLPGLSKHAVSALSPVSVGWPSSIGMLALDGDIYDSSSCNACSRLCLIWHSSFLLLLMLQEAAGCVVVVLIVLVFAHGPPGIIYCQPSLTCIHSSLLLDSQPSSKGCVCRCCRLLLFAVDFAVVTPTGSNFKPL